MRQAGALLLPSDEDGTALDNARRNKKGGECVALLEAAMKLRGHLEQVGALATSRYISIYLHISHHISPYLTISHHISLYLTCAATSSRPTASTASPTGPRRSRSEACELDGEIGRDRLRSTTRSTGLDCEIARAPLPYAELDGETRCERACLTTIPEVSGTRVI